MSIKYYINNFLRSNSLIEDSRRKEFILNVLLFSSILFLTIAVISYSISTIFADPVRRQNNSISLVVILFLLGFFVFLYILSRRGFFRVAASFLLGSFFILATYMSYIWGIELPTSLLFYVLIIVMSGILIHARFAFAVVLATSITIAMINHFRVINIISPNLYWKSETWRAADIIMTSIIFLIIATVSWLSNREIEKSLARAHKSEADLKAERDNLEIKVEERTRELKEIQAEKMTQIYRFAEFGRLSSGLFHDLINPLNAVSLNMERVRCQNNNGGTLEETKEYLDRAISASKKMEEFVMAVRKQLTKQGNEALFSITNEIKQVVEVLSYKALQNNVKIIFSPPDNDIEIFGDAIKFNQVALNLITNAIDAYASDKDIEKSLDHKDKRIIVSLKEEKDTVVLSIQDYGMGIQEEHLNKIFEPFFTTKNGSGMGIGLSMVKRIVEKDFEGTVKVVSEVRKGATFTILIPKKTHEKNTK
jgi:signal transduction histidine kinase